MANSLITFAVESCFCTSWRPPSIQPGSIVRMKLGKPIGHVHRQLDGLFDRGLVVAHGKRALQAVETRLLRRMARS